MHNPFRIALAIVIFTCFVTVTPAQAGQIDASQESIIRVPQDVANLQTAISQVSNGGIIEMAAGVYNAPPNGFLIGDLPKSFTIRAASGASVILDGGGVNEIVTFINSNPASGGTVVFQGLTFRNGRTAQGGRAGGVTLQRAKAAFINCSFQNNGAILPAISGGGILVAVNSSASFTNCSWIGNSANFGGGLAINESSQVSISNSSFTNNRTNLPGHSPAAAGGAIHAGNPSNAVGIVTLTVSNTSFEGNQAGYVGGAIFAIGNWKDPVSIPNSQISIFSSTFTNNRAVPDPSVTLIAPTEGGAIHAEDQTTITIQNSTFTSNSANVGGAVNLYRAIIDISGSTFRENRATGLGAGNGFGGAVSAISNDTLVDGAINRRSASVTIKDTLIEGLTGQTTGQIAAGLFIGGDGNRTYGLNNVPQNGTAATNRATAVLNNVIFNNTDVQEGANAPGSGVGGAITTDLANLTMQNVLFIAADALGAANSSGGGMAILNQSSVSAENVTIAGSTAGKFGGGIFTQGSEINMSGCKLIENEISPGVAETDNVSFGAAIFTSPDTPRNLPALGTFGNCMISNNVGLPIYEGDRTNGPINDVRYNSNQIYSTTFGNSVYRNDITGLTTVAGLNSLTVVRANGQNTPKSQSANSEPTAKPSIGALVVMPPFSADASSKHHLGYAWSGTRATLDGATLGTTTGVTQVTGPGTHTLDVDGTQFTVTIIELDQKVYLPAVIRQP